MKTLNKLREIILIFISFISLNLTSQISDIIPPEGFGGESNQQIVMDSWALSGAAAVNNGNLHITTLIDVNEDWNIYPGESNIAQRLQAEINRLNHDVQSMIYFPAGSYDIESPLIIPRRLIIKGAGGDGLDPFQTHFHFDFTESKIDAACITFSTDAFYSSIEDICFYHDTGPSDKTKDSLNRFDNYGNTVNFNTGVNNCWMRGVESVETRRFHVNIIGYNNTISGCYFHHAYQYGEGGQGYGVVLSGNDNDMNLTAHFNRVENNVFNNLRHAMVFQYYPAINVLSYNYDANRHASEDADIAFHTKKDNDLLWGPIWNLCEGNDVEYIRFDKNYPEIRENGPYNTIFRCYADDKFKVSIDNDFLSQYMQNVVGSNANPANNGTKGKIKDHGFHKYWLGDDWEDIPSGDCSYYLTDEPAFYDYHTPWLFSWPFLPDDENLIPAEFRYRRNNEEFIEEPYTTEVIKAGWDIYDICGPPNIFINDNDPIIYETEEYIAMHKIEVGPYELASDNNIVLKCQEKIILKPGFNVNAANNNYFHCITGDICESKSSNNSEELASVNTSQLSFPIIGEQNEDFCKNTEMQLVNCDITFNSEVINIFPNPNNGIFTLYLPKPNENYIIQIFDINGKLISEKSTSSNFMVQFDISDHKKGLYLLKLYNETEINHFKIIYSI